LEIPRQTKIPLQSITNVGVPPDGSGAIGYGRAALYGSASDAVEC
jgi:hypothetical protein